jgi:hypothetical protein
VRNLEEVEDHVLVDGGAGSEVHRVLVARLLRAGEEGTEVELA